MKTQLLKTLQHSRTYTLAVAEAMPEKSYSFKPTEAVWNFKELIDHIAYGIEWWQNNFMKGNKIEWNPPGFKSTKKQVIENLLQAFDTLEATIHSMEINDRVIHGYYATLDHITHHRGQATVYLRCQGIAPPEYSY